MVVQTTYYLMNSIRSILISATGIVTVMTLCTGGCHQVGGMAIPAGGALMVDAVSIAAARVRSGITRRRPSARTMTLAA